MSIYMFEDALPVTTSKLAVGRDNKLLGKKFVVSKSFVKDGSSQTVVITKTGHGSDAERVYG